MTKATLPLAALIFTSTLDAQPQTKGFTLDGVGLRGGTDSQEGVSVNTAELYATVTTPYQWRFGRKTELDLKLEGAVGILENSDDSGYYLRFGPQLVFNFGESPLHIVISSGVACLSDHTYSQHDLGGDFQFFTSMGFDWDLTECWTLGYRWQHISNAGIHDVNPGLNLHTLGLTLRF